MGSNNDLSTFVVKKMKIYTRKGDDGKTALIGGDRVSKHHIRVESYGTVDELNSNLGFLRCGLSGKDEETIAHIQNRLFMLGSYLASSSESKMILPEIVPEDVQLLENEIDRHTNTLPELKNFILPGGSNLGSHAHVARCVCRRAERLVVHLAEHEEIEPLIIQYLNRLSDYLFILARFIDHASGNPEIIWEPRK